MDQYLVLVSEIDLDECVQNKAFLYHRSDQAQVAYYSLIDNLKKEIAERYEVSFEQFDLSDFGDIIKDKYVFEFKDYAGIYNIKYEIIRL